MSVLCLLFTIFICLAVATTNCSPSSIPHPSLDAAKVEALTANTVRNFTIHVPQNGAGPYFDTTYTGLDFCNVTITHSYTEANSGFSVHTTVWLPLNGWNGRFQGTGGSGFSGGLGPLGLAPAVAEGYAAAETDGGHSETDPDLRNWALGKDGKLDLQRLQSFAATSLNDLASLGKAVTESFYGTAARYSYWNGCSTGGRQGLMLAQRFPNAFDGILALSPAINWPTLTVSTYWPQQVMSQLEHFPHECELQHITKRAVQACDADDGVEDGIVSLPGRCSFDANKTIGETLHCAGKKHVISSATATVANAAWSGNGIWYGLNRDATLEGMVNTTCSDRADSSCRGNPFDIYPWIADFVEKDPNFDISNMTNETYFNILHASVLQYQYVIGTANPDLSLFKAAGGKMISTHGLADPAIFPNGTIQYYKSVLFFDQRAQDYYRLFEAPGIGHCTSLETLSYYPSDTLQALIRWVEEGEEPETLTGVNQRDHNLTRPLCPFPSEQRYVGGDPDSATSFHCR